MISKNLYNLINRFANERLIRNPHESIVLAKFMSHLKMWHYQNYGTNLAYLFTEVRGVLRNSENFFFIGNELIGYTIAPKNTHLQEAVPSAKFMTDNVETHFIVPNAQGKDDFSDLLLSGESAIVKSLESIKKLRMGL